MDTLSSPIFLQIINALNIGVMVFDQQQQLKVWNHWLEKHAELPASLVCGKSFAQLFPELCGSRVESAINGALRQGFPAFLSQSLNKSPFDLYSKSASNGSVSRIQQATRKSCKVMAVREKPDESCCTRAEMLRYNVVVGNEHV